MKYYLAEKKEYYNNQSSEYRFVLAVDNGHHCAREIAGAREYSDIDAANQAIAALDAEIYVTSHNEVGRPEYKAVSEEQATRLEYMWAHEDMGSPWYVWDHCADPDHPTDDEIIAACAAVEDREWAKI